MSGDYKSVNSPEAHVTMVEVDRDRRFIVVRYKDPEWKTLVLQQDPKLDFWISKRESQGSVAPVDAVTGVLLGTEWHDVVTVLKRQLQVERRSNSILYDEIARLKSALKAQGKKRGGKRGRRNS